MNNLGVLYEEVKSLDDLVQMQTSLSDGESHELETKKVPFDLNTAQPSDRGDFKLLVAKAISAFANTDGGLIALGVDDSFRIANSTSNLLDWVDRNERDLVEPILGGIKKKTCLDSDGNSFVLLYIPKGKTIPYRVHSVKPSRDKNTAREYFQRVGSNSTPIPESIVRYMYLSRGRAIDIEISPKIIYVGNSREEQREIIRLGLFVKPDKTRLIEKYYLSSEASLLDRHFKPLSKEPLTISEHTLKNSVIPPTSTIFMLSTFDVRNEIFKSSNSPFGMSSIEVDNMDFHDTETINAGNFQNIYAIHIHTEYACDGMPMKIDDRILVIGNKRDIDKNSWHEESGWINDNCKVVRYISFGPNKGNLDEMYAMENYIRQNGLD